MPAQVHMYLYTYIYKTCSTEALITIRMKIFYLEFIIPLLHAHNIIYMYMYNVHMHSKTGHYRTT